MGATVDVASLFDAMVPLDATKAIAPVRRSIEIRHDSHAQLASHAAAR
jgi:hypothetical protein